MGKYAKRSRRQLAKAAGVGLVAGGLLLGAPAGIASADPLSDAAAQASEAAQKAAVAGSQTYQQAVVAGSQTIQKAGTATSHALSSALKGLFGKK